MIAINIAAFFCGVSVGMVVCYAMCEIKNRKTKWLKYGRYKTISFASVVRSVFRLYNIYVIGIWEPKSEETDKSKRYEAQPYDEHINRYDLGQTVKWK